MCIWKHSPLNQGLGWGKESVHSLLSPSLLGRVEQVTVFLLSNYSEKTVSVGMEAGNDESRTIVKRLAAVGVYGSLTEPGK